MCVDGETLLLPDIEKPYIPRKRIDGSLDYYRALLRTIHRRTRKCGIYKKVEPDADISGHILTAKGNDELNRKREISIIKELSLQPQIGLINVQNSFSGSCCIR